MKKCAPRLSQEQIARLDSIGFEWCTSRGISTWEEKFKLLQDYVKEFGNPRVPTELDTVEYPKLGAWVAMQRQSYRNEEKRSRGEKPKGAHRISPAQIAKLSSIGFHWTVGNRENRGWKQNLAAARIKNGRPPMRPNSETTNAAFDSAHQHASVSMGNDDDDDDDDDDDENDENDNDDDDDDDDGIN